jgi:hypothetical protein
MKIAFLHNHLDLRGTVGNLYDYAHFNETILGNESIIITMPYDYLVKTNCPWLDGSELAYDRFNKRFRVFYYIEKLDIIKILIDNRVDVLFIGKAGNPYDNLVFNCCKSIIHCVFQTQFPHGTLYTSISDYLNILNNTNIPVLPNIVQVYDTNDNLKSELNIPDKALVFGTYSGRECFNIQYIRDTVINIALEYPNIYFIFMNIYEFGPKLDNVKFLKGSIDMEYKRKFINTCDAMLYGRDEGETFGIACGEFSMCNKPIIARKSRSGSELHILGDKIILHDNSEELKNILLNWDTFKIDVSDNGYKQFTPENVMKIFDHYLRLINNKLV